MCSILAYWNALLRPPTAGCCPPLWLTRRCAATPLQLALPTAPPPVYTRAPMTRDTAPLPTTPASPSALAAGDASNGQHHLLRHVLSPEQCSDALHHFGTADSKAAARMVNRMSQRELRDMFAKVGR